MKNYTPEQVSTFVTWALRNYIPMETVPLSEVMWIPKVREKERRCYTTEELIKKWEEQK
jgi:hypothetical protein